jgi:hypothetical protein
MRDTVSLEIKTPKKTELNLGNTKIVGGEGENGATFYPDVSPEGIISWTNDKELPNPTPVNIRGKDGIDGEDGQSVYVSKITQNIVDGEYSSVEFSDGTSLKIKNGNTGSAGEQGENGLDGFSPTIDISKQGRITTLKITDKNGTRTTNINDGLDGENGENGTDGKDGISAYHEWDGTTLRITSASGTSSADLRGERGLQGIQGIQGEKGDPFFISKVYTSVVDMNNGYATDEVKIGQFVVIETGDVNDEDNAKLFIKGNYSYEFLTDLSGAQGMRGPAGIQGEQGIQGERGETGIGISSIVKSHTQGLVDTYTINYTDGSNTNFTVTNGINGKDGEKGADGTSVTVSSVSESSADGGSNVVTFSNGKTLTVKNGSKGKDGTDGKDYVLSEADKTEIAAINVLTGKKIVYDGDSICESRTGSTANNGGGYAKIIADMVGGTYFNNAVSGKRLAYVADKRNVVGEINTLPTDGDLYCFEGGYNDYWTPAEIGECSSTDYTGTLDTSTICGALETIFRYSISHFIGKPICFVITHKCGDTGHTANSLGHTFNDYREAIITVCEKYSIPYYDAFMKSGLNGWNTTQSNLYLTANAESKGDGIHPNEQGYKRYYVPQLIEMFKSIMPTDVIQNTLINQIPISIDTDGSVFNQKGWIEGKRISSSGEIKTSSAYNLTGYIPITSADKLYISADAWQHAFGDSTYNCVAGYTSDFTFINVFYYNNASEIGFSKDSSGNIIYNLSQQSTLNNVAYVRVCGDGLSDLSIITINEPIE